MRWMAVLTAITLAGCAAGPTADEAPSSFEGRVASDEPGLVGVVVDAAVRPVAGATITISKAGEVDQISEALSDQLGRFAFTQLDLGGYNVRVTAPGFLVAETFSLVAGPIRDAPVLKVVLDADLSVTPYYEIVQQSGYLECSTSAGALCALVEIVPETLGTDPITDDVYLVAYYPARPPDFLQVEAVWEYTQSYSKELWMVVVSNPHSGGDENSSAGRAEAAGPSPLISTYTDQQIPYLKEPGVRNVTAGFYASGWNPLYTVVCPECHGSNPGPPGIALQQEFDVFFISTYNFKPPQGWSFAVDGPPLP